MVQLQESTYTQRDALACRTSYAPNGTEGGCPKAKWVVIKEGIRRNHLQRPTFASKEKKVVEEENKEEYEEENSPKKSLLKWMRRTAVEIVRQMVFEPESQLESEP